MNFVSRLSLHPSFRALQSALRRLVIGYMWKRYQLAYRRQWPDDLAAKSAKVQDNMR
jgi:hypothetical protein